MATFDLKKAIPNYSPAQTLQMHMDEAFQAAAAPACGTQRELVTPGFINGDAYERIAKVKCTGHLPEGYFRQLLQNATPSICYQEYSRYRAPLGQTPQGEVDIAILAPSLAAACVNIHIDLSFEATASGTCRTLRGEVVLSKWLPAAVRAKGEAIIATQMKERLTEGAQFAADWATQYPDRYP